MRDKHADTRKRAMQRVQVLLKSLMLRRQKDSVVDGQIVCALPPKHLSKKAVEFSDEEHAIYKALETKSQIQLNKYLEKGTLSGECIPIKNAGNTIRSLLLSSNLERERNMYEHKLIRVQQPTTQTSLSYSCASDRLVATLTS